MAHDIRPEVSQKNPFWIGKHRYKAGHTIKYDHRIGIVVVKPEDYGNLFESSTLTCRYFKLFSHTELRKTLF